MLGHVPLAPYIISKKMWDLVSKVIGASSGSQTSTAGAGTAPEAPASGAKVGGGAKTGAKEDVTQALEMVGAGGRSGRARRAGVW